VSVLIWPLLHVFFWISRSWREEPQIVAAYTKMSPAFLPNTQKKIGSSSWRCSFSEIADGAETVPNKFQAGWVVYGAQPK
jgi:hypothetical protein